MFATPFAPETPKCVTLPCMITRTIIYRDADLDQLAAFIDYMAEEAAWAVRQITMLEPVHPIQVEATSDEGAHTTKVLTVLVVYEREKP